MSTGEGHGPTIKVEVGPGPGLEVNPGPSQSRPRACSQGQSRDRARTQRQCHHRIDSQNECPHSPEYNWELPNRRVSFHIPGGKELVMDRGDSPTEPSINDLELWLEHQAEQVGTPTWWGEWGHAGHYGSSQVCPENPCILLRAGSPVQDVPGSGVFHTSSSQKFE